MISLDTKIGIERGEWWLSADQILVAHEHRTE